MCRIAYMRVCVCCVDNVNSIIFRHAYSGVVVSRSKIASQLGSAAGAPGEKELVETGACVQERGKYNLVKRAWLHNNLAVGFFVNGKPCENQPSSATEACLKNTKEQRGAEYDNMCTILYLYT